MLAVYYDYEKDAISAKKYIDISMRLSAFPKNILFKVSEYSQYLSEKEKILMLGGVSKLVLDKQYENSIHALNLQSLVTDTIKEIVQGTYMTSFAWEYIKTEYRL